MHLPRPAVALVTVWLAAATPTATPAAAQTLVELGWEALRAPRKYPALAPELIVPPDLPGRQRLVTVQGPTTDGGDDADAVDGDGARRFLAPEAYGDGKRKRWEELHAYVSLGPSVPGGAPEADLVGVYDAIAEAYVPRYPATLAGLPRAVAPPTTRAAARTLVADLAEGHIGKLSEADASALKDYAAVLALCRGAGLSARVGFGVRADPNAPGWRRLWLEVYVPGEGYVVATALRDVDAEAFDPGGERLLTFGFLGPPSRAGGHDEDTGGDAAPAYAPDIVAAWLQSKVRLQLVDSGAAYFNSILPYYRTDDARFVAEADALLTVMPADFNLRLFRATALSRLGRREEATPIYEDMLRRRRALGEFDYAHLLWSFGKHLAWGGHVDEGLRYARGANARAGQAREGFAFDFEGDPDWGEVLTR